MIRPIAFILNGGAWLLPLFVYAHDGELLLARLEVRPDGRATLRVTADLEANSSLRTPAEMAKSAPGFFELSSGQAARPLGQVAGAPSFSRSERLDPEAPMGHTAEEMARTYRLENAEWSWVPAKNFTLRVPAGSPHTFLLWVADPARPKDRQQWVMLIGGDESPLVTLPAPPPLDGWDYLLRVLLGLTVGLPLLGSIVLYVQNRRDLARRAAATKVSRP